MAAKKKASSVKGRKSHISEEGRAAIAKAQRKRWREWRKNQ